jgi:Fe-S-cluster-containing dehydrogenase component
MRIRNIRKRYAMTIDIRRCVGCSACVLACKGENNVPLESQRCWVEDEVKGVYPNLSGRIYSARCNQCTDAPCVTNCPTGASHYSTGGVVMVDRDLCTGCKACVASCPYDARYIHADGYADKCTFCLHRAGKGMKPACVGICPTSALAFGDLNDPTSDVSMLLMSRRHEVMKPEAETEPNVFYLT